MQRSDFGTCWNNCVIWTFDHIYIKIEERQKHFKLLYDGKTERSRDEENIIIDSDTE